MQARFVPELSQEAGRAFRDVNPLESKRRTFVVEPQEGATRDSLLGLRPVRNRFGPPPPTPLIRLDFPVQNATDPEDRFGIRSVLAAWRCGAEKIFTSHVLTGPLRRSGLVS